MNTIPGPINLSSLLSGLVENALYEDQGISGLSIDSRNVAKGDLFIALPGTQSNGNDYIESAIEQGAVAVVYEAGSALPDTVASSLTSAGLSNASLIPLKRVAIQAGVIASRYYGEPSLMATVTGITGTNGKTSCSILIAQCLQALGKKAGVIGTLGTGFLGEMKSSAHTTPDAVTLQKQLSEIVAAGAVEVLMEVSSHGLQQERVSGTTFNTVVFTNLSQDHLDYHGSMDSYGAEKAKLFFHYAAELAVINSDDDFGRQLLSGSLKAKQVYSYGIDSGDVRATQLKLHASGIQMEIDSPFGAFSLDSKLMGRFNAYNLLACATVLLASGHSTNNVAQVLSRAEPVAGRMEVVTFHEVTAVVDFAHTPDALEQALQALRSHSKQGRLICVFGCGGNRDQAKRPLMGAVAEQYCDVVIITDDNPRNENPADIRAQIISGMSSIPAQTGNRRQAIQQACGMARQGDILLIAGKGHETTQQVGDLKIPFNDREVVMEIMIALHSQKGKGKAI